MMISVAMIEISREQAEVLFALQGSEVYELENDGTQSIIHDIRHFDAASRFGIEGAQFDTPCIYWSAE